MRPNYQKEIHSLNISTQKEVITMRLIDANALYASIAKDTYILADRINSKDYGMFLIGIKEKIDNAPTIEPSEQVTSKLESVEISTISATESTISQPKSKLDLINRVDAVESVCDVLVNSSGFSSTHGYHIAEEALNGLPSVSAEPTTRERKETKSTLLTLKHLFEDEEILKALDVAIECVSIESKRGEWINEWKDIDGGRMYGACCSLCHSVGHAGYRYCPNCGAYMGVSE